MQVGLSGSGKSTLVAMLERLYDPTSGQACTLPASLLGVLGSIGCIPGLNWRSEPAVACIAAFILPRNACALMGGAREVAQECNPPVPQAGHVLRGRCCLDPDSEHLKARFGAGAGGRGGPAPAGLRVAALAAGCRVAGPAPVQRERGRQHRLRLAGQVAGAALRRRSTHESYAHGACEQAHGGCSGFGV